MLHVRFQNGKHFKYNCGRAALMEMLQAKSMPGYFARNIRPHFVGIPVEDEQAEFIGRILKRGQRR